MTLVDSHSHKSKSSPFQPKLSSNPPLIIYQHRPERIFTFIHSQKHTHFLYLDTKFLLGDKVTSLVAENTYSSGIFRSLDLEFQKADLHFRRERTGLSYVANWYSQYVLSSISL